MNQHQQERNITNTKHMGHLVPLFRFSVVGFGLKSSGLVDGELHTHTWALSTEAKIAGNASGLPEGQVALCGAPTCCGSSVDGVARLYGAPSVLPVME
jgi:hypothetical protein